MTDPNNPTPLETGIYDFDLNPIWSIDNNVCIPFCSAGQVVKVNNTIAFVAAWDHSMGGRNGGLWMIQFQSPLPDPKTSVFPFAGASKLAGNKGLGGKAHQPRDRPRWRGLLRQPEKQQPAQAAAAHKLRSEPERHFGGRNLIEQIDLRARVQWRPALCGRK